MRLTLLWALALGLVCSSARADWEGRMQITETPPPHHEMPPGGHIAGKGSKMRMEMTAPKMGHGEHALGGAMVTVMDLKAKKGFVLMEQRKAFMTLDLAEAQRGRPGPGGPPMPIPTCDSEDPAVCLAKEGFHKGGSETVNGWKAHRWERDRQEPDGTSAHDAIWIPEGFKEFVLVRHVHKTEARTVTFDVLDLKKADLPASQFEVPAGYQDFSAMMENMRKGMPGMPPGGRMHGKPSEPGPGAEIEKGEKE